MCGNSGTSTPLNASTRWLYPITSPPWHSTDVVVGEGGESLIRRPVVPRASDPIFDPQVAFSTDGTRLATSQSPGEILIFKPTSLDEAAVGAAYRNSVH